MKEHELAEAAWREWRDNASQRGQSPDSHEPRVPAWFFNEELGFAFEHGPSLRSICINLATLNRSALLNLERFYPDDVPDRVTYPLNFQKTRVRRVRVKRA